MDNDPKSNLTFDSYKHNLFKISVENSLENITMEITIIKLASISIYLHVSVFIYTGPICFLVNVLGKTWRNLLILARSMTNML